MDKSINRFLSVRRNQIQLTVRKRYPADKKARAEEQSGRAFSIVTNVSAPCLQIVHNNSLTLH